MKKLFCIKLLLGVLCLSVVNTTIYTLSALDNSTDAFISDNNKNTKTTSKVKNNTTQSKSEKNKAKNSDKLTPSKKKNKESAKVKSSKAAPTLVTKNNVEVIRVIDGDTIEVTLDGKLVKIRLIGIQAPELFADPVWPYAQEAKDILENMFLYSKKVSIEYLDIHSQDKYGRILADVFSDDGIWINGYLIDKSLAYVYILNHDIVYIEKLIQLENKAIIGGLKIWNEEEYKVIKANRAYQFVNLYKIIDAEVLNIKVTQNSIWLEFETTSEKGFSARINKENMDNLGGLENIKSYKNKKVRIRGFIEKYSSNFGPFVDLKSPYQIEILNE